MREKIIVLCNIAQVPVWNRAADLCPPVEEDVANAQPLASLAAFHSLVTISEITTYISWYPALLNQGLIN